LSLKAQAIVVGALFSALAIYSLGVYIGFSKGKESGRVELWEEQKQIIGIADDEMITFPSGAVMYASGRIERAYKIEPQNPYFQGQCVICHNS
jgi:hypothetical protein